MQKAATFKAEIPSSLPNRRVAAVRIEFVQAWREEVGVLPSVPRPADERDSITDVEGYLRRTARGAEVPVIGVASLNAARRRRPFDGRIIGASFRLLRTLTPR